MKRVITFLLTLMLIMGMVPLAMASEAEAAPKTTVVDTRITAYTAYLKELFKDGGKGKITHVGMADVNKDYRPELFYIWKGAGKVCEFHFCGFDGDEVYEFEIEQNYIGVAPGSLSLRRMQRRNSSDHIWILQSTGKQKGSSRKELLYNVFTRAGDTMVNEMYLARTWTGSNKNQRYRFHGIETTRTVYEAELSDLLYGKYTPASTTSYKNEGAIRKVASPTAWQSIVNALNNASVAWKALKPVSK